MVERKVDWEYLVLAFLVTAVIVSGVFFFGQQLNNHKVDSLRNDIQSMEINYQSQRLGLELAGNIEGKSCEAMSEWVDRSSSDIEDLRSQVAAYESSSKIDNPDYTILKKRYMNLLLQNLIEIRSIEEECNRNVTNIIYFYSKGECDACEDQGTILTHFVQNNDQQVIVYPLDTDLDMDTIDLLEEVYDIERYPALVIDGELYQGFQSKENISNILQNKTMSSGEK